ncbi:MAG: glycosyltransferase [Candidatus Pacebacteria bacterium]|nr:glycosyltransferase [Candidatus Paceibacterota bacterium]
MSGLLTVAIVTKNRKVELNNCLSSLVEQKVLPNEVLVIDNDPARSAQEVIKNERFKVLNIKYLNSKKTVPGCRNLALVKTKTKFLAFTDDDCVLTPNWLASGLSKIKKHNSSYVLGNSLLLNKQSILASAQFARENYWRKIGLKKDSTDPREVFDTKNVIINMQKIIKNKLKFDEKIQFGIYDTADFDFGYQLKAAGLTGCYEKEMKLYHAETSVFRSFAQKAFARGKLMNILQQKFEIKKDFINKRDVILLLWIFRLVKHFRGDFKKYSEQITGGTFKKLLVILSIKVYERFFALGYSA